MRYLLLIAFVVIAAVTLIAEVKRPEITTQRLVDKLGTCMVQRDISTELSQAYIQVLEQRISELELQIAKRQ